VAIYERRLRWPVLLYSGIDPLPGRQRRISGQVKDSRKQAESLETRPNLDGLQQGPVVGPEDLSPEGPQGEVAQNWREVAGLVAAVGLGADPAGARVAPGDEGGQGVADGSGVTRAGGQDQGVLEG
jgi:hypothetical protein